MKTTMGSGLEYEGVDPKDRREHRRLPFCKAIRMMLTEGDELLGRPMEVWAEDISEGGIRMRGRLECWPGVSAVVQLGKPDGSAALVGISVVHTEQREHGECIIGARFMNVSSELVRRCLTDADGRVLGLDRAPALRT